MIVVDIETSGLSYVKCGIWQIGALDFNNPDYQFIQEGRIDDEDLVQARALEIIGKTEAELRDPKKQSQKELMSNFFNWCLNASLMNTACENPQFDFGFLRVKAEKYGLRPPYAHRAFDLHSTAQDKYHDIFKKFLVKDRKSDMDLSYILRFVGIEYQRGAHNALEDAKLEAECFSRLYNGRKMFSEYAGYDVPDFLKRT